MYLVIENKDILKEESNKIVKFRVKLLILIKKAKNILDTITDGDIFRYFIRSKSKNQLIIRISMN